MASSPLNLPGLVCFWEFQEPTGHMRVSRGPHPYRLRDGGSRPVERVSDKAAPFGTFAARFASGQALHIPRAECPALNIHGTNAQITIAAWVWREACPPGREWSCQAVAGMWNEHSLRQYCLFLNLQIHDSAEQVGAHVSAIGGATPGCKYCMDAAIGATRVPLGTWQTVVITYDGTFARSYLNGKLDARGDRNPYRYEGGLFDGGENGADFTVGAVTRPERVDDNHIAHGSIFANSYCGLLGGLAVFDRALTDAEIAAL